MAIFPLGGRQRRQRRDLRRSDEKGLFHAIAIGLSALVLVSALAGTTVEARAETVTLNVVTAWSKDSD